MRQGGYLHGVLGMTASSVVFSLVAVILRASPGLNFFAASFYRFAVGMAALCLLALGGRIRLEFHNTRVLLLRGLFGGFAVVLFYMGIQKLGVGRGTVINYTFPIFATLGGILVLKHRVRPVVWPLLAAALLGMALLVGVLNEGGLRGPPNLWSTLAVVGAIAAGSAVVCVKRLTESDASTSIFMSQSLVGFWMTVVPANLVPSASGLAAAGVLVLLGLLATLGQLLMTWSYRHLPISTGAVLGLLTPALNLVAGIVLFGERLRALELAGAVLIIATCAAVALLERPAGTAPE